MAKLKINRQNSRQLLYATEILYQTGVNNLELEFCGQNNESVFFPEIIENIYKILDYEDRFGVWLRNIPFCILNKKSVDHILPPTKNFIGEKKSSCRSCRYFNICSGFPRGYFKNYGEEELLPIKDIPNEIMLEVETKCNFKCSYCFNKASFAKNGRNLKNFSADYVKKIIEQLSKTEIETIRFTGGEPLLRNDLIDLMSYAKERGLYITLNTNASLITPRIAKKLKKVVDNVLISIESCNNKQESKITGFPDALKKKKEAVNLLKQEGVEVVRVGMVITEEIINDLDAMENFILRLSFDELEFYRPVYFVKKKSFLTPSIIEILVEKIIDWREKTDKKISIVNTIPFCAIKDLNKMNSISEGALFEDGHSRLVIDPRDFVKPHYFIDKKIGSPLNILKAWQHPFVKKMRNLDFLPKECQDCNFRFKCCGGSRYAAKLVFNSWRAPDPLADYKNI